MHLPLFLILGALLLAACGQSEPQAKGEAGPPGPAGPPGFQRRWTGDQVHYRALRSNGLRRELRGE